MPIVRPKSSRRAGAERLLIAAGVLAGLLAILPIIAAAWTELIPAGATRTAFATAPAGSYAVVARSGETADEIFVVAPGSEPMKIAEVQHLPGYSPVGSVSPDGRSVALVVADAGTLARPGATVLGIDLESGAVTRLAVDVDYLQAPVWALDSRSVVVTRTVQPEDGLATAQLVLVPLDLSGETVLATVANVLGAYPVAFDPQGRLVSVVIDAKGSTAYRGSQPIPLSSQITRDWRLSPDGTQLAYVEADTSNGLRYAGRTSALDGSGGERSAVAAASVAGGPQQLGAAWRPGSAAPTFGVESGAPASSSGEGVSAQALSMGGFDVPLAYSPDGDALAVERWSGSGFNEAGSVQLQVVRGGERLPLDGFTRFFGWAAR